MDTIELPITGKKVKIAKSDFPEIMQWEDAEKACKSLGKGWRLPTMVELEIIGNHLDEIGGFCNIEGLYFDKSAHQAYWSSDQYKDWKNYYHYANFSKQIHSKKLMFEKDDHGENHHVTKFKVRAVKTVR